MIRCDRPGSDVGDGNAARHTTTEACRERGVQSRRPVAGAAAHCFKKADNSQRVNRDGGITTTGRRRPRGKRLSPSLKTLLLRCCSNLPLRTDLPPN